VNGLCKVLQMLELQALHSFTEAQNPESPRSFAA
jgi:hypothetical protein